VTSYDFRASSALLLIVRQAMRFRFAVQAPQSQSAALFGPHRRFGKMLGNVWCRIAPLDGIGNANGAESKE
jgi:hypothetical protein